MERSAQGDKTARRARASAGDFVHAMTLAPCANDSRSAGTGRALRLAKWSRVVVNGTQAELRGHVMLVRSSVFARALQEPSAFHVRPHRRGWCITADAQLRPLSVHATRQDAVGLATALSKRGARVWVHDSDGVTREVPTIRKVG
jgi:hypothetical protein